LALKKFCHQLLTKANGMSYSFWNTSQNFNTKNFNLLQDSRERAGAEGWLCLFRVCQNERMGMGKW
jgi:hypothetical protein